jgi:alpha,alpha-trehalase
VTGWTLLYEGFSPAQEGLREALCTVGNGYFATRGAAPESRADGVHYPGTYAAGCYNRLVSQVADRKVENEDLVNLPNWLCLGFRAAGGRWFDLKDFEILEHRQELDIRRAVLTRQLRCRDETGRLTRVTQRRFVSMADAHIAALETTFVAENWSGRLEVRSGLDGRVVNAGVPRYRELRGDHLEVLDAGSVDTETVALIVQTRGSLMRIAEAARTRAVSPEVSRRVVTEPGFVAHELALELSEGVPVTVEKVVTLFTSRDQAIDEPATAAHTWTTRAGSFDDLLKRHVLTWDHLWRRFDIELPGPPREQMILRLHILHMLQTVSEHGIGPDVGVPARGLHGEAYRGHVFWDELFILPVLNLHLPELSRALLDYRYRRLPQARWAARQAGCRGALYPWQSGTDGREESQVVHLNPRSGRWVPDHSHLQRHIGIAVAYNVWEYYQSTGDTEFLQSRGAEMLIEIARLFASLAEYNRVRDRYEIHGVMGPDEYHDGYPDESRPGIDNNAYTNVMTVWVLCRALEVLNLLVEDDRQRLRDTLGLSGDELELWDDISRKMYVPFHADGIISQFEGYGQLAELDWDGYRRRYGDIHRLDRILEAEGDTTNRYMVSKQADTLMLFYLLSAEELTVLFERLGYSFDPGEQIPRTIEHYLHRTAHGSTLSRLVHSWVLARLDRRRSWEFFLDALHSDVADVQGGTTAEGIHLGAMAGTVDLVQRCYGGVETRDGVLWLNPYLPHEVPHLLFTLQYRGQRIRVMIDSRRLRVETASGPAPAIRIGVQRRVVDLEPGQSREFSLTRADRVQPIRPHRHRRV